MKTGSCRNQFDEFIRMWSFPGLVLLPSVTVAMPPEATAAEVAALVAACDQAYHQGGCQEQGEEPAGEVVAEVHWHSETEATVSIGIRRWKPNRWIRRDLHFEAQDAPTERYKSLGFALGGLAGTVIEVASLEAEARNVEEPTPEAEEPEPAEEEPASEETVALPIPTTLAPQQSSPSTLRRIPNRFSLGGVVGPGLSRLQMGGTLGVGVVSSQGWLAEASARYAVHSKNSVGFAGEYVGLQFAAGYAFDINPIEFSVKAGPLVYWFTPSYEPSGAAQSSKPKAGALAGLQLEISPWVVSPFIGFDAGYVTETRVELDQSKVDAFGPWTWQAAVGLRVDSNLL